MPHTPIQGKESLVEAFSKKVKKEAKHQNPTFAAMVHSMDDAVGTVLEALERNGLSETTLVVFTSDNGGLTQRYGKLDGFTDNHPPTPWQGVGLRRWRARPYHCLLAGVTPAGSTCDEPVIGMDFYPTILEIAGVKGDAGAEQGRRWPQPRAALEGSKRSVGHGRRSFGIIRTTTLAVMAPTARFVRESGASSIFTRMMWWSSTTSQVTSESRRTSPKKRRRSGTTPRSVERVAQEGWGADAGA